MQLPLDLGRRWGVQDHCSERDEDTGSPARDKVTGDVTPGSICWGALGLGIGCQINPTGATGNQTIESFWLEETHEITESKCYHPQRYPMS